LKRAFLTVAVILVSCAAAQAGTIFQTAPQPRFQWDEGVWIDGSQWVANYFTVSQTVTVTDIGGAFDNWGNKPIFGAILSDLPRKDFDWYESNIGSLALGYADFLVPSANGGGIVDVPL